MKLSIAANPAVGCRLGCATQRVVGTNDDRLRLGLRCVGCVLRSILSCSHVQLAFCDGWKSFVPAVCGAIVGSLYVMDTMSVQAVRLPDMVYRCFWVSRVEPDHVVPLRCIALRCS